MYVFFQTNFDVLHIRNVYATHEIQIHKNTRAVYIHLGEEQFFTLKNLGCMVLNGISVFGKV